METLIIYKNRGVTKTPLESDHMLIEDDSSDDSDIDLFESMATPTTNAAKANQTQNIHSQIRPANII